MTSFKIYKEADLVMAEEIRDVAPAHYELRIESFSLFAKNYKEKYESNEFEAGGYKCRNGEDHISIYLAVSGTSPFQPGGAIHSTIRFSLYDQICDRYLTKQGRVTRFHASKVEWGVPRYLPLKIFADPSNGYLVDDTCVFGVEVFVIKSSGVGECVTTQKDCTSFTEEYVISRFADLGDDYLHTEAFTIGVYEWKVRICPRGDLDNRGKNLSMFLVLTDPDKLASGQKVIVRFIIRLKDKNGIVLHQPEACTKWFSSSITYRGWPSLMPLKTVRVKDSLKFDIEVAVLSIVSKLP
ncbi:hypothetical protein ACJRO7_006490 [Eucalyptus globulus]|uniref:MATH domain-containing protein n=1 Tax=Eucalyptus globulus TaxID=34317 RepID=A0ABD3ILN3_EUCGL